MNPPPRLREIRRLRDVYLIAQPPLLSRRGDRSRAWYVNVCLIVILAILASPSAFAQNEPPIWTGVFNDEQADRGKANFAQSCTRCHGQDLAGLTAPSLNGNRFITTWENENLYKLFVKIRDTMPPNFGTILTDEAKLDVVAFLLRTNGYPAGSEELKVDADSLENIQIVRKGATQVVSNFSVVRVVGCLTAGPNNTWMLSDATEPVLSRDQPSTAEELKRSESLAAGNQTFRLVNVAGFHPEQYSSHRMDVKGLLYKDDKEARINVTSFQKSGSCPSK